MCTIIIIERPQIHSFTLREVSVLSSASSQVLRSRAPSHTLQLAPLIGQRASYHVLATQPTFARATDRPDVRADGGKLVNLILLVQDAILSNVSSCESFYHAIDSPALRTPVVENVKYHSGSDNAIVMQRGDACHPSVLHCLDSISELLHDWPCLLRHRGASHVDNYQTTVDITSRLLHHHPLRGWWSTLPYPPSAILLRRVAPARPSPSEL